MSKHIAVLVSGGGTNLQALIDAQARGELINGEITAVISSNPGAYALERAAKAGIPGYVVARKEFPSSQAMTAALVEQLRALDIDLVVLAGFMVILTGEMVRAFPNAILNVHPALIPPSRDRAVTAFTSMRRPWSTGSSCPAPPSTSSARSATAAPSSCKRRWRSFRTTPRRSFSGGSWSSVSGSSCPKRSPCSVRAA